MNSDLRLLTGIKHNIIWHKERLASFVNWVYCDNAPCSRHKLAEAGFFMNQGDPNSSANVATCFVCFKSLYWDEEDDPWSEHTSHCPDCPFVKLNKKEKDQTLEEFINMMVHNGVNYKRMFQKVCQRKFDEQIKAYKIML